MSRPFSLDQALAAAALAATLFLAAPAAAQDEGEEKELGWFDQAELSLVASSGNSETETLSLRNTLSRVWPKAELRITAGGLRAESTALSRGAVGTSAADAQVVESSTSTVTAERYFLNARYDREISQRLFWYAGAGWLRNEPAGIRDRTSVSAGVGNLWFDRKTARFRTGYGVTYTDQKDLVEPAGGSDPFAGLQASWEYWRQLTSTTTYGNDLVVDQNLDDTSDLRLEMVNTLSVSITEGLALKLSLEALFDNQPSLVALPVRSPAGDPTGDVLQVEVDDLDTLLTVALVVTF